jgi:hypothetical protein
MDMKYNKMVNVQVQAYFSPQKPFYHLSKKIFRDFIALRTFYFNIHFKP